MKLLKKLYSISSPSGKEDNMIAFIASYVRSRGYYEGNVEISIDKKNNNMYITKGKAKSYPCIVSHLDEVCYEKGRGFTVINTNGVLFGYDTCKMEQNGIGGDDKNGIWIALKMLDELDCLKIAFFSKEEIGCGGSEKAWKKFFKNCRYVIQCDRRGNSDFVTNIYRDWLCSREFVNDCELSRFGYSESSGALTDVYVLKQNFLEVSCCNLSCGYYNPHTDSDATVIEDLLKCLELVRHICSLPDVYRHEKNDYYEYALMPETDVPQDEYQSIADWLYENWCDDMDDEAMLYRCYEQEMISKGVKHIAGYETFCTVYYSIVYYGYDIADMDYEEINTK